MSTQELFSIQGIDKVKLLQAIYKFLRTRAHSGFDIKETTEMDERTARQFLDRGKLIFKIYGIEISLDLSKDMVDSSRFNELYGNEHDFTPFQTIAGKLKPPTRSTSTSTSNTSRTETKTNETKKEEPKVEERKIKEEKEQEIPSIDMFQRKALNQFLKESGLLSSVSEINTTPHNEQIHILCKTADAQEKLIKVLKNLIESQLKYTPENSELGKAFYPSDLYDRLVQAHIPFEENSVVFDQFQENRVSQIKFPYGSLQEAQKLALFLLYNLKNPSMTIFQPPTGDFPTLSERIALLPDVSNVKDLEQILGSYSDIIRVVDSRIGEFGTSRVAVVNYHKLTELLVSRILGQSSPSLSNRINELRLGVYVNGAILGKALTLNTGGPTLNIGIKQALKFGSHAALQLQIDHSQVDREPLHIAALVNTTNRNELGKLFENVSKHLSKYSEIYFSLIICNEVVQNPIKRVLVTKKNLSEINRIIESTKFEGAGNILSALELLKTVFESKNEYPIILTATEGFTDVIPNFPDQVKAFFASYPRLPVVKAFLFDKKYEEDTPVTNYGKIDSRICTEMFAALGNRGSQFIDLCEGISIKNFSTGKATNKLEQFMLTPSNPLSDPIQVEFRTQGITNPFRGVIPANRLNEPTLRNLFIPSEVITSASARDGKIEVTFRYQNRFIGTQVIPVGMLEQANSPSPTEEITFSSDWIEQMFFFYGNVTSIQFENLPFSKQFDIIHQVLSRAKELKFKEAESYLKERLKFIMNGLTITYLYNEQFAPIVKNRINLIIKKLEGLPKILSESKDGISGSEKEYIEALLKALKDRQTLTFERQWQKIWQDVTSIKHPDYSSEQWEKLMEEWDIQANGPKPNYSRAYKEFRKIFVSAFEVVTMDRIFKEIASARENADKAGNVLKCAVLDHALTALKTNYPLDKVTKFEASQSCFSILHLIRYSFNVLLFPECVNYQDVLEHQAAVNTGKYFQRVVSNNFGENFIVMGRKTYQPNHAQAIPQLDWMGYERHKTRNGLLGELTLDLGKDIKETKEETKEIEDEDAFAFLERTGSLDAVLNKDIVQSGAVPFVQLSQDARNLVVGSDGGIYDRKQAERMQQHFGKSIATGGSLKTIVPARGLEPALKLHAEGDIKGAIEALEECPITFEKFTAPMCCMQGGHIFDKGPGTCPFCRSEELVSVKAAIDRFRNQWQEELRNGPKAR